MILAGGIGERLYPLTSNRAKPAVIFGGSFRILDFTLMNCVGSGFRRIHVLTQYHAQSLNRHKAERWSFLSSEMGEYIDLVPPKMRAASGYYQGTADALFRNLDLLDRSRPDLVLVLSGDHVYRADYRRFIDAHLAQEADITVLTGWVDEKEASSFGVVSAAADGRITRFMEKPADPSPYAENGRVLVNLGVYCFGTKFLVQQLVADAKRKTAHDFGRNILPASLEIGGVWSCPLEVVSPDPMPYWRDVGSIDSYFQANMDLLAAPAPFELTDPRWPPESRFHEWVPARVAVSARLGSSTVHGRNLISSGVQIEHSEAVNSIFSPRVRVGRGCELEECILFPGAEVGDGAALRRVIVEEGVSVPAGARIGFGRDAEQFTTSPGGVVVISASYRFGEAEGPGYDRRLPLGEAEDEPRQSPASSEVETV
jgi:glucose-1-phosphate adenylyltransferase